ncbi:MAG: manganese efflux pump [Firmicutes bacterium]|nr:manganese efflux pump [Bacillota bacterium]
MELFTVLLVAVALGTDALSLAVGIGMTRVTRREILVLSGTISIFHVFMPLAGFLVGEYLGSLMGRYAVWLGATVLLALGIHLLWDGLNPERDLDDLKRNYYGIGGLLLLAVSVSLDALGAGFSLGAFSMGLPLTIGLIGVTAGLMTAAGLVFGRYIGRFLGNRAELLGGVVLIILGIKMFF